MCIIWEVIEQHNLRSLHESAFLGRKPTAAVNIAIKARVSQALNTKKQLQEFTCMGLLILKRFAGRVNTSNKARLYNKHISYLKIMKELNDSNFLFDKLCDNNLDPCESRLVSVTDNLFLHKNNSKCDDF